MQQASDLPRRRRRRISGRAVLITLGVLFIVVAIFGRALARFYVDYLWHEGLGRTDVFWGQITAKLTLFGIFALVFAIIAGVNLFIADRLAPQTFPANVHPVVERFHEVFGRRLRPLRYVVAGVLALLLALPTTSEWQAWLMIRNSTSFGTSDPEFGADVGFYLFELPFLTFALDWMFVAVLVVLIITVLTHVLNGAVVFASAIPTVRTASKAHIAVLLAVLAALKAADYWVGRYELTNDQRGFVQGATYAVVNAEIPALMLLMLVAVVTASLFLASIRSNSWRLPLLSSALWIVIALVGQMIYPALVQRLVVRPNQEARELAYIERNVDATRAALDIAPDEVNVDAVDFSPLTAQEVASDLDPLRDARLLAPDEMESRFVVDQGEVAGLTINDLDVDRYKLDGRHEQVLIAARELDLDGIPNTSWQGQHLINTRGCGLVMAPTSMVRASDDPDYRSFDDPEQPDMYIERPELYFSEDLGGYAIVNTDQSERSCREGDQDEAYAGEHGVEMSSFVRRASFALAFLDYNVLGSGAINGDSQMLWRRGVRERVSDLAPFLRYDGDPYPVAVDGRVKWVLDAYTTSSRYPYGQSIGDVQLTSGTGLSPTDNYIRNSVKAVVDAYDGSVTFYAVDPDDPILRTWQKAFPDLFTSVDEAPDDLVEHFRYPEDLFRIQTEAYSKYQLDASAFFDRSGAWSVAQSPSSIPSEARSNGSSNTDGSTEQTEQTEETEQVDLNEDFAIESGSDRFEPYYTYFHDGGSGEREKSFVLLRPFVPFSRDDRRTELQAYMTASSDPDTYGDLTVYRLEQQVDGPLQVTREAETQSGISEAITFLNQQGSNVRFGNLQLVPIGGGLLYVRPFYVGVDTRSDIGDINEYRYVMVMHADRSAYGRSLREALGKLFPGFDRDVGDRIGGDDQIQEPAEDVPDDPSDGSPDGEPQDEPEDEPGTDPGSGDAEATVDELLRQADELMTEADAALREDGDLGRYQELVTEANTLIEQALSQLENGS